MDTIGLITIIALLIYIAKEITRR